MTTQVHTTHTDSKGRKVYTTYTYIDNVEVKVRERVIEVIKSNN